MARAVVLALSLSALLALAPLAAHAKSCPSGWSALKIEDGMVAAYPTAIEAGRQALRQNAGAATPSGCKIKTYNALYKFMACQKSMGGGKRYQFVYRIKFNCSGATKERTFFTQVAYKGGSYKAEKWAPM